MRNASRESFRSHTLQIGDDVVQILVTEQGVVINRHQGFAAFLNRTHFVLFEQMNFLVCVHHLQAEVVLVESNALDLPSIRHDDGYGFVLLSKLFRGFRQSPSQLLAWIADGFDQGFHGSSGSDASEVRPNAPTFSFDHVAQRTVRVAIKKLLAVDRIADGLRRRFDFDTSQIGDDLPDFFIGHSHALAVGSVGRHCGAGDSVADVLEHVPVGTAMALLRMSEIWAASPSASTKSVAESTVD